MKALSKEHIALARNELAKNGYEFTPDELEVRIREIIGKIREELRSKGVPVVEDDEGMFVKIAIAMTFGGLG